MEGVAFQSVVKVFRHHPALFNWVGRERGGETRALDRVSLNAAAGEVLVLLGPNGAGKTTLLKLISTMLLPDAGSVTVCGADTLQDPQRVRSLVGFAVASERSFYPRLTARENLDLFATLEDIPRRERPARIGQAFEITGLLDAGDTLTMKFSTGMFQRLAIARALLKNPAVFLMDEPTRSLDPGVAGTLWKLVRSMAGRGTAVVLATHNFDEALSVGDAVIILRNGQVAAQRRLSPGVVVEDLRRLYFCQGSEESAAAAPPVAREP